MRVCVALILATVAAFAFSFAVDLLLGGYSGFAQLPHSYQEPHGQSSQSLLPLLRYERRQYSTVSASLHYLRSPSDIRRDRGTPLQPFGGRIHACSGRASLESCKVS
jgi:hypothetical protein